MAATLSTNMPYAPAMNADGSINWGSLVGGLAGTAAGVVGSGNAAADQVSGINNAVNAEAGTQSNITSGLNATQSGITSLLNNANSGITGTLTAGGAGNAGTLSTAGNNIYDTLSGQKTLGNDAFSSLISTLGLGGGPANYSNFTNMPGYQFAVNQGTQAINRQAGAQGSLFTPNTLASVGQYVTGTAAQDYNTYVNQLLQSAGFGQSANQMQTSADTALAQSGVNANTALTQTGVNAATTLANTGVGASTALSGQGVGAQLNTGEIIAQLLQNKGTASASGASSSAGQIGQLLNSSGVGSIISKILGGGTITPPSGLDLGSMNGIGLNLPNLPTEGIGLGNGTAGDQQINNDINSSLGNGTVSFNTSGETGSGNVDPLTGYPTTAGSNDTSFLNQYDSGIGDTGF